MSQTTARGYGWAHQQMRARWAVLVATGGVRCSRPECPFPGRIIQPWQPWDLDHTDDRAGYSGPAHRKCNRAAGARKGNKLRRTRAARSRPTSRMW